MIDPFIVQAAATDKKQVTVRLGAVCTILALTKEFNKAAESYAVAALTWVLDLCGDKDATVASTATESAKLTVEELASGVTVCNACLFK